MPSWLRPKPVTVAAAGLVLSFVACSSLQLSEYGQTTDESRHRLRGQFTIDYLHLVFETRRIPTNRDVGELASRLSVRSGSDLDLNHPLLFPLIAVLSSDLAQSLMNLPSVPAAHLPLLLFAGLGLWHLFLLARHLFGERVAFLATLLMVLFPPFVAHAQYNPKDIPVMSAVVIALYHCSRAVEAGRWKPAFAAGLLSAAAVCTKLDGLFILPIFGLSILAHKDWRRFRFAHFLVALFVGIFLMWPLLWTDPLLPWRALQHFSSDFHIYPELFFGKVTEPRNLPWFYSPLYLVFGTPTLTLTLVVVGLYRAWKLPRDARFPVTFMLTWLVIPVGLRLAPNVLKYGGMRHVFVSVPPMIMFAALGLDRIVEWIRERIPSPASWLALLAPALLAVQLLTEVIGVHPFEGAYFNEAARAIFGPELQNRFDLDRWFASYAQGSRWVDDHASEGASVCAPLGPWLATNHSFRRDLRPSCTPDADYVLRASTQLEPEVGFFARVENDYQVLHRIRRMDSTILTVYGRRK